MIVTPNLDITKRSEEKIKLVQQWVQDVCYCPELRVWKETEFFGWDWRRAADQPQWNKLSFEEWLFYNNLPTDRNCPEGTMLILRRPYFQGWATSVSPTGYEGVCMADSCKKLAVSQIAWNCWGTCVESFVCLEHKSRHGVWADRL